MWDKIKTIKGKGIHRILIISQACWFRVVSPIIIDIYHTFLNNITTQNKFHLLLNFDSFWFSQSNSSHDILVSFRPFYFMNIFFCFLFFFHQLYPSTFYLLDIKIYNSLWFVFFMVISITWSMLQVWWANLVGSSFFCLLF